jgi:hypothetical protein
MAGTDPFPPGPAGPPADPTLERPTQAAELRLTIGPATAGGTVPPVEARYLITAFGIAACVAAGIAGVILTLRIASQVAALRVGDGITVLAFAELGLGLAGAALIALCGRRRDQAAAVPAVSRGDVTRKDGEAGFLS